MIPALREAVPSIIVLFRISPENGSWGEEGGRVSPFSSIPEILDDLKAGKMIVLVDDENRENEGDLVMAAEKVTPEAINFMRKHTGGVICLPMDTKTADRLSLPPMVNDNTSERETAFTVSIDARRGITTGISSQDRAVTIMTTVHDRATAEDLARPGHIFPLRGKDGGVLVRAGHTEGSIDLCRLAGMKTVSIISEIMNEDGGMSRLPELIEFSKKHDVKISSIAQLIEYRRQKEKLVEKVVEVKLPTLYGDFQLHLYKSKVDDYLHLAFCAGGVGQKVEGASVIQEEPILVRVHSECLTGDIFGSKRCECGEQLDTALARIQKAGKGILLYIRQEGRGIGLINKLKSYELQEQGFDTVDANLKLGLPADLREYGTGAQILYDLGIRKMRILTNNPKKMHSVSGYGLEIVEQIPIEIPPSEHNREYLRTKRDRMGHIFQQINEKIEEK
jgi:3,4-dihydroxy 2-butanone 4-phosphate synthase/GTP cyclohydrolase II